MSDKPSKIYDLNSLFKQASRELPIPPESFRRTKVIMLQLSILRRLHTAIQDSTWADGLTLELLEERNALNIAFQCKTGNVLLAIQFYELGKMEIVAFTSSEAHEDFRYIHTWRDNPFGLCAWLISTGELLSKLPPYDDAGPHLVNVGKAAEAVFTKVAAEDLLFAQYKDSYDLYVELAVGVGAPVLNGAMAS